MYNSEKKMNIMGSTALYWWNPAEAEACIVNIVVDRDAGTEQALKYIYFRDKKTSFLQNNVHIFSLHD